MSRVGMDVRAMHHVADDLERTAKEINGLVFRVNGHVNRGIFEWLGDAAREYSNFWLLRSKVQLLALEVRLLHVVGKLRAEIAAQERTSAPYELTHAGAGHLLQGQSALYDHGKQQITAGPTFHGHGPRNVNDLLDPLHNDDKRGHSADPHSVYHYEGGVSVSFIGEPPDRHVIVTVAGTRGWDPDDLLANGQNLFGLTSAKEAAIEQAMLQAGVLPSDKIMLVGHSLGGASAIGFAANHSHDARFHVDSIVTVGAPDTPKDPPNNVDVLELRGSNDLVPRLGFEGGGPGSSVHRVNVPESPWSSIYTAHDPAYYQDNLPNAPEIEEFQRKHSGFFTGGPSTTSMYSNDGVR